MTIPSVFTKNTPGGIGMKAENLWQAFLSTGAPELYVLYAQARKVEESHVFDSAGTGPESSKLQ